MIAPIQALVWSAWPTQTALLIALSVMTLVHVFNVWMMVTAVRKNVLIQFAAAISVCGPQEKIVVLAMRSAMMMTPAPPIFVNSIVV